MIPFAIPLCRAAKEAEHAKEAEEAEERHPSERNALAPSVEGGSAMADMGKNLPSAAIPDKLYYPIREVAQLTGVEPYVLRFWEKEFPMIRPPKGGTGHRRYRRKEIETILEIKRLLYDEGFTIAGARAQLQNATKAAGSPRPAGGAAPQKPPRSEPSGAVLQRLRRELNEILTILNKP